jgi:CHAT domain-containing protein
MIRSGTAGQVSAAQRGVGLSRDNRKTVAADLSHPFYWAAFIQSGEWRSLDRSNER